MEILQQLSEQAGFIWKGVVAVIAVIWIYEGTRILNIGGQRRRGIKALLSGALVLSLMVSVSIWTAYMMGNTSEKMAFPGDTALTPGWGANLAGEARERTSRAYASAVFTRSGKIGNYFDQSTGWTRYCPTDADIALREKWVSVEANMHLVQKAATSAVYRWLALGFIAALLGFFSAYNERKSVAASTA